MSDLKRPIEKWIRMRLNLRGKLVGYVGARYAIYLSSNPQKSRELLA